MSAADGAVVTLGLLIENDGQGIHYAAQTIDLFACGCVRLGKEVDVIAAMTGGRIINELRFKVMIGKDKDC